MLILRILVSTLFVYIYCVATSQTAYTLKASDVMMNDAGEIIACSYDFSQNANGTELTIPSVIGGVSVTGIAIEYPGIFEAKNIVKLTLPTTLKMIGGFSFQKNALETLTLHEGLESIGRYAFYKNQLRSLKFPQSLTYIGYDAFRVNEISNLEFSEGLKFIDGGAFSYNKLVAVTLPSTITDIGNGAFSRNDALSSFIIPCRSGLEGFFSTDDDFIECGTEVDVSSGYALLEPYVLQDGDVEVVDGVIVKSNYYFNGIISIPSKLNGQVITGIGKENQYDQWGVFEYHSIRKVILPNTLKTIGSRAFLKSKLSSIIIPNGVTRIGYLAFEQCDLTSVSLPGTLTELGWSAFSYNEISDIDIPASLKVIPEFAFSENLIRRVSIPEGVESIGRYAFVRNSIDSVVMPSSVTDIKMHAFAHNKIKSLSLSQGLRTIGEEVFNNNLLTKVTIPDGVIEIGKGAFGRNSIAEIQLPFSPGLVNWLDGQGNRYLAGSTVTNLEVTYRANSIESPYVVTKTNPYAESFSLGSGGWYSGVYPNDWHYNWDDGRWTNKSRYLHNNWLQSPLFDVSALDSVFVEFILVYELLEPNDQFYLEVSGDGGEVFTKLDVSELHYLENKKAWSGLSNGEVSISCVLPKEYSGSKKLLFRFSVFSGREYYNQEQLVEIRSFYVGEERVHDLAVKDIILPTEFVVNKPSTVSIVIENLGNKPVSAGSASLKYSLDEGENYVSETYRKEILPKEIDTFVFAQEAILGSSGELSLLYEIEYNQDAILKNNVFVQDIYVYDEITYIGDLYITTQTEMDALRELLKDKTIVSGNVQIGSPSLGEDVPVTDLSPLSGIERIDGHLTIGGNLLYNTALRSLLGLSSIKRIGGNLSVSNSLLLTTLEGLDNLQSVNNIQIKNNISLDTLCALNDLVQVYDWSGEYTVERNLYNPSLKQLQDGDCFTERAILLSPTRRDLGTLLLGDTVDFTVQVSSKGTSGIRIDSTIFPEGIVSEWYHGTLNSGDQEVITLTFIPTSTGDYNEEVVFHSNGTSEKKSSFRVSANVEARTKIITLSDHTDFGNVSVDDTVRANINISNSGNSPLTINGISTQSTDFLVDLVTPFIIAPNVSKNVTVSFVPTQEVDYLDTLTILSDADNGLTVKDIEVKGVGVSSTTETRIVELLGDFDFGSIDINQESTKVLIIHNRGNTAFTISGINSSHVDFSTGFSTDLTILPGDEKRVDITYKATTKGFVDATLTVVFTEEVSGQKVFVAQGYGVSRDIKLSGSLNFGSVDVLSSFSKLLTVTNTGNRPLQVTGFSMPTGYEAVPNKFTIDGGGSLDVAIVFSPIEGRDYNGDLNVTTNATNGGSVLQVQGKGLLRTLSLPEDINFGVVSVGEVSKKTLNVRNTGNAVLQVNKISLPEGYVAEPTSGTIGVGDSMDFLITFTPVVTKIYKGEIVIHSDAVNSVNSLAVEGGISRLLSFSGSLMFGEAEIGATATKTLTIANDGNSPLTIGSIEVPSGFEISSTVGTIVGGSTMDFTITFSPKEAKSYSGSIVVVSDATNQQERLSISGIGTVRTISLTSLDFGEVVIGEVARKSLIIANTGNKPLTVQDINFPVGYIPSSTTATIGAGESTAIDVEFSPQAVKTYSGSVVVSSDAMNSDNTTTITGNGVTRTISLSGSFDFGGVDIGEKATKTLTISNTGSGRLTLEDIDLPVGFDATPSEGVIARGETMKVTITFSPSEGINYSGSIVVASNATNEAKILPVSGVGTGRIISLTSLDFGEVVIGEVARKSLIIANTGNKPLTVQDINFPVGYIPSSTTATIGAGESTAIDVEFSPQAVKTYSGSVVVSSDAMNSDNTTTVTGKGVVPAISLSTTSLDFGDVAVGTTTTKTFTVSNTGNGTLVLKDIYYPRGYQGTPTNGHIGEGESLEITVTFSPEQERIYFGEILVVSNATDKIKTLGVRGTALSSEDIGNSPFQDIKVEVFSESCPQNNDGQIVISNRASIDVYLQLDRGDRYLLSVGRSYRYKELESGHYKLYVSSGSLRKKLGLVITEPSSDPIQVSTSPVDGLTKSFNLAITGGRSPYTVKLGEKRYSVSGQQLKISDVPLGKHHIEVTDSSGCSLGYSGEIFVAGALKYYPNPVQDFLTVMLPEGIPLGENYTVRIMNSGGQVVNTDVISPVEGHLRISFQDKARGVYLVAIFDATATRVGETMKIVLKD